MYTNEVYSTLTIPNVDTALWVFLILFKEALRVGYFCNFHFYLTYCHKILYDYVR